MSAPATDAAQLNLGIETETAAAIVTTKKIESTRTTVTKPPLQHPGRMKLPEHLRREEVILNPPQDVTGCKKIGEEITEQLDYVPGELFVRKYVRPKYALPEGKGVTIASLPEMPEQRCGRTRTAGSGGH
jgi:transposase